MISEWWFTILYFLMITSEQISLYKTTLTSFYIFNCISNLAFKSNLSLLKSLLFFASHIIFFHSEIGIFHERIGSIFSRHNSNNNNNNNISLYNLFHYFLSLYFCEESIDLMTLKMWETFSRAFFWDFKYVYHHFLTKLWYLSGDFPILFSTWDNKIYSFPVIRKIRLVSNNKRRRKIYLSLILHLAHKISF